MGRGSTGGYGATMSSSGSSMSTMKRRGHHDNDNNSTGKGVFGSRSSSSSSTLRPQKTSTNIKTSFEVETPKTRHHHAKDTGGHYHVVGGAGSQQRSAGGPAEGHSRKMSLFVLIFFVSILVFGSYMLNPKNPEEILDQESGDSNGIESGQQSVGGSTSSIPDADGGDETNNVNDTMSGTGSSTSPPSAVIATSSPTMAPSSHVGSNTTNVDGTSKQEPTASPTNDINNTVVVIDDGKESNATTKANNATGIIDGTPTEVVDSNNTTNTNSTAISPSDGNNSTLVVPPSNDDGDVGSPYNTVDNNDKLLPPNPMREEERVVYFGVPPTEIKWPDDIPRQAINSPNKLLDPPRTVHDPYGWMRDESRTNETILNHIEKENNYTKLQTKHLKHLQDTIYNEFHSMLQETDYTLPLLKLAAKASSRKLKTDGNKKEKNNKKKSNNKKSNMSNSTSNTTESSSTSNTTILSSEKSSAPSSTQPSESYWYYSRTYEGQSYSVHCRAPYVVDDDDDDDDEHYQQPWKSWDGLHDTPIIPNEVVYLDENVLCKNQKYCDIGVVAISPSQEYVAYTVDYSGYETYQLFIKQIVDDVDEKNDGKLLYNSTLEFYNRFQNDNDDNNQGTREMKDGTTTTDSTASHSNYTPFSKSKPATSSPTSKTTSKATSSPTSSPSLSPTSPTTSSPTKSHEKQKHPEHVKHTEQTGKARPSPPPLSRTAVWGDDDTTLFYLVLDDESRPYQLYKKDLTRYVENDGVDGEDDDDKKGDDEDVLLYEENDDMFWLWMEKTLDGNYLIVDTSSSESSEVYYLPLKSAHSTTIDARDGAEDAVNEATLTCIAKRRPKVLYSVEHRNNEWWIVSNLQGTPNFQLFTSPVVCDKATADTGGVPVDNNASAKTNETKTAENEGERHRGRLLRATKKKNKKKKGDASSSECPWTLVMDPSSLSEATEVDPQPLFDGSDVIGRRVVNSVTAYDSLVVLEGREDGIPRIWILWLCSGAEKNCQNEDSESVAGSIDWVLERLEFPEAAHDVSIAPQNLDFHITEHDRLLILDYSSLVTPYEYLGISLKIPTQSVNDFDSRVVIKQKAYPGYAKDLYGSDRITVMSRDGHTEIPVSLVYHKDTMSKLLAEGETSRSTAQVPVHMYAYGAYGNSVDDYFASTRLALLNRGVLYVIVHVRGGGEMGRNWYQEPNGAKYLCKKNTFNDFIDVARWLIDEKQWTTSDKLSCEGRSAGGLTIGASLNQAPELFRMAIMGVPFVDLMCTMVDASIPLTAGEWEEWGNPSEEKYFDYMLSYSPMNNVPSNATYPSLLVLGGLYDPRVQYWEPAKFAATVRHQQQGRPDANPVLLQIDSSSGHFSASDRYKHLKQRAFEYSVLLDQLGLVT